jgi:WD40 repeat protein
MSAESGPLCSLRHWIADHLSRIVLAVSVGVTWLAAKPIAQLRAAENLAAGAAITAAPEALPARAIRRLGWSPLRIGHSAFALRPDGKEIVTVSPEGIARRFDAHTGRLLEQRSILDRSGINPINPWGQPWAQLSNDGRIAAIADGGFQSKSCSVIDVASGKVIFRRTSGTLTMGMPELSPRGNQLAILEYPESGRGDPTLHIYDTKTGKSGELGKLEFNYYGLCFSADGNRLAALQYIRQHGEKALLYYFDVPGRKQLWKRPLRGSDYAVSPDGTTIVSAVTEGVTGFDVIETKRSSREPTERFVNFRDLHWFVQLRFAPDNRTLVFLHGRDALVLLDLPSGTARKRIALPTYEKEHGQWLGAFSADGKTVVTNRGYLQRWNLETGKPLFEPPADEQPGVAAAHLAFSADGKKVFAGSSRDRLAACWDTTSGKLARLMRESTAGFLMQTRKGPRLLEILNRKREWLIHVSDPAGTQRARTVPWPDMSGSPYSVRGLLDLSGDGRRLLVVQPDGPWENWSASVCDVETGRRLTQFTVPARFSISRPPFSPCGRWIVIGDKLLHLATGRALFSLRTPDGEYLHVSSRWSDRWPVWFSGDGRLLAGRLGIVAGKRAGAIDTLAVWEVASGSVLARFPRAGVISEVAFSPDSRRIALVDGQGVRVHDLVTGKAVARFEAPDVACEPPIGGVTSGGGPLAFAPDGKTLATGHRDGSVTLWSVPQLPASARAAAEKREKLWADLASPTAATGRAAVERLMGDPEEAIALLKARFTPPTGKPGIAELIKQLDAEEFAEREAATRKLAELGCLAEIPLRRAARTVSSLEARRRIGSLLQKIAPITVRRPLSGAALRGVRAIEIVERLGTDPARKLLEGWADQTTDTELAAEARAVLGQ